MAKVICLLALPVMMAITGCGGGDGGELATVSGKVTVNGQPLKIGTVNFYNKESAAAAQAKVDENGQFEVETEMPTGTYNVFIMPPEPSMPVMENADKPKSLTLDLSDFPDVPARYRSGDQTDVTVDVTSGENTVDIIIPPNGS